MKNILFKKIISDCNQFFLITLFSASIIIWVFQAVNYLDIMIEDGRSFLVYTNYTLLSFPKIISKILPFSIFFSFFYIINQYETNNELMIFWTSGIHKIKLVNFFLKVSLIIVIAQILLTSILVPFTQNYSRTLIKTSNVDFLSSFVKPKIFNDTISNLTIYAEEKDSNGVLKNLYLKKTIGEDDFQITYAKKGRFVNKNGTNVLVLDDGETINSENKKIMNFNFSKSDFGLTDFKSNTITQFKIQETNTLELFKCIKKLLNNPKEYLYENCSKKNQDNIIAEILKRFLIPFYIPILILIACGLIIIPKENNKYLKLRISIFITGILIIILSETSLRFVHEDIDKNVLILIVPIVIFASFYKILSNKFNLKKY